MSGPPEDPRTRLAAERTLLAWVRTGLAMMGFGFVVARFGLFLRELAAANALPPQHSMRLSLWIGTGLVLLGVVVTTLAAQQHFRFVRRLERGEPPLAGSLPLGLIAAALVAFIGGVMAVYLTVIGD